MSSITLAIVVVPMAIAATTGSALANGGAVRVSARRAGPYDVSVFTSPSPVVVGTMDVSVLVQRAGSSEVVNGASVVVRVTDLDRPGESSRYDATRDLATNKLYYAANVELDRPGRYRVDVSVSAPDGDGEVSFDVEATRPSALDNPILVGGLVLLPIVALAALYARWVGGRGRAR